MKTVNRLLWAFTVALHVIMISIIVVVGKSQFQHLHDVEKTATVAVAQATNYVLTYPPPNIDSYTSFNIHSAPSSDGNHTSNSYACPLFCKFNFKRDCLFATI